MGKRTSPEPAFGAVIGHPIKHSLSPEIFLLAAQAERRPVSYQKLDVRPERLRFFLGMAKRWELFTGCNVTAPHKEAMARLVNTLSIEAKAIGAANVVHFTEHGTHGYNTDVYGIRQTLKEQGKKLRGKTAILYGAGGAARAVAFALGKEGLKQVHVTNRTPARARALCRRFNQLFPRTKFLPTPTARLDVEVLLLVNTIPAALGVKLPLPDGIGKATLAFDLSYRPTVTPFLKSAKKRGAQTVNGLDMLIWQALATWEIWFGELKRIERLKASIKKILRTV